MEVIRRGQLPGEKNFEGTCNHCKSVVKAKSKELKHENDGRNGTDSSAQCPVCGSRMYFQPCG